MQIADCAAQVVKRSINRIMRGWDYANHPSILAIHEHNSQGYFKFQPTNQVLVGKLLLDIK